MHSLIQLDLARTLAQENARQISERPSGHDSDRSRPTRAHVHRRRRAWLRVPLRGTHSN